MHTGIGSSGSDQRDGLSCHPLQPVLYGPLDRTCIALTLPAFIGRAVVFYNKFEITRWNQGNFSKSPGTLDVLDGGYLACFKEETESDRGLLSQAARA